jgi:hypothetical protein
MNEPNKVYSTRHIAERGATSVHAAVNEASRDRNFIDSADRKTIALFQSLNGTMQYRDRFHLKKSLEQENSAAKQEYQISNKTRKNLQVEKIDRRQKRKDYPEIPASAIKNYICNLCGKEFQSSDQLKHHQELEFK